MDLEALYKLKAAALLHAPPSKPFEPKMDREVAKKIAEDVLGGGVSALIDDSRITLSDKVASSFERWILSILMGDEWIPDLFRVEAVKIKNIAMPSLSKDIAREALDENAEKTYVSRLKGVLEDVKDWKLKYHLLYLLYEPLWILEGLPWGPVDARVPTHSVFDHDYATAAVVNWTFQDPQRVKGLLVGLDVAGVERFIASSRKVRDAWISSYIVSALLWYTVVELIDKLGPDVLLMPSLRMNPFYLYWLEGKLGSGFADEKLKEKLEKLKSVESLVYISDKVHRMYTELGIPPYSIIPGRATLILPPADYLKTVLGRDYGDLRNYFTERFERGWRLLWRAAKKLAELKSEEGKDPVWTFVRRVFDYYEKELREARFDVHPPLYLRVEWVDVDSGTDESLWQLYDNKYRELIGRLSLAKYRYEEPETQLELYDITERLFGGASGALGFPKPSGRGFEYCTSCGRLPAIVVLPSRESENIREDEYGTALYCAIVGGGEPQACSERIRSGESKELANEYSEWRKTQLEKLKPVFTPGERLCPWCFLKRVLSLEPRLLRILLAGGDEGEVDEMVNSIYRGREEEGEREVWFPSTAHIASTRLYDSIARLEPGELRGFVQKAIRLITSPAAQEPVVPIWYFVERVVERVVEELRNKRLEEGDADLIRVLIRSDPVDLWFNPDRRASWSTVLEGFGLSKWFWRYYALIRADGDSIGDLLEGKLTAFLSGKVDECFYDKALAGGSRHEEEEEEIRKYWEKYVLDACEGEFKEFVKDVLSGNAERWPNKIAGRAGVGVGEARERIERVKRVLESAAKDARIIVSPSYHVAVSGALTRIAMLDVAVISELDGFVAYAGGDDLMAFAPVDRVLEIVRNTRRGYGGAGMDIGVKSALGEVRVEKGFLSVKGACLPLLPGVGRSYCAYIAHYHYPLSVVIARSSDLLEEAKGNYWTEYPTNVPAKPFDTAKKDVLVVAYNPRAGSEDFTVIPLTLKRPADDVDGIASALSFVSDMLRLVDERVSGERQARISHSVLYDASEPRFVETLTALVIESRDGYAGEYAGIARKLLYELIRRNVRERFRAEAERLSEELLQSLESSIPLLVLVKRRSGEGAEKRPAVLSAVDAVRLVRSGMR